MFGIFAALAEFERELIRERTVAGLKAPRARGRKGGRKVRAVESPGDAAGGRGARSGGRNSSSFFPLPKARLATIPSQRECAPRVDLSGHMAMFEEANRIARATVQLANYIRYYGQGCG